MRIPILAMLVITALGVRLHAQAPLTTDQLLAKVGALEREVARLTALCAPPPVVVTPPSTGLSSLAAAAAEAAKVKHEWTASTYTAPAAPAIAPSSAPPADTTPAPSGPSTGPTAAQRHELELTAARTTLRQAQDALRAGEDSQRQLQRTYDSTCHVHGDRLPLELIRPCVDLEFALTHDGPAALARLKAEIRRLAILLGLDPVEASRSNAVR